MSGPKTAAQSPMPAAPISNKLARTFLILCGIALALWIAALLAMYFVTVYPQRHPAATAATSDSKSG